MGRRYVWVGTLIVATTALSLAAPPTIPPADSPPQSAAPSVVKVEAGKPRLNGEELLPKSIAAAREVLAKTRDYAGFLVRQERVNGVVQAEQVAELRVRMTPNCVNLRVVKPDSLRGEETSYMPEKVSHTVRFKPAGVEGVRGFRTQPIDSPKVMAHTRHPITDVGLTALLNRVEAILATEHGIGNPVAVVVSDYQFAGKNVIKFELFAPIKHPNRYAAKVAIYFDAETKLPVRFEASDNELLEVRSYVGIKTNVGLGDAAFVR